MLIYLSISVLLLFGAFITSNKPSTPAITFIAFLLITPMFMIDRPYYMSLELFCASTVFSIWMYFVKDPEASKNELLGKAVSDAKEKASVLTSAAGVSLKDIQSIDYSWGEINFEYYPMNKELLMEDCMCEPCEAGGSYDVNMEPDDIEVSDTVTVIWELG